MKKLIVSMKSTEEMFDNFKKVAGLVKKGKVKSTHYEISFESEKNFHRFLRNIKVLMAILHHKPSSIYELAKLCDQDVANMKKTLNFFEEIGAVRIENRTKNGRKVKRPVVEYSKIEFDLEAA